MQKRIPKIHKLTIKEIQLIHKIMFENSLTDESINMILELLYGSSLQYSIETKIELILFGLTYNRFDDFIKIKNKASNFSENHG